MVQALLADGSAGVNTQNQVSSPTCSTVSRIDVLQGGRTALIYATIYGHTAVVEALLSDGRVDVDLRDNVSDWGIGLPQLTDCSRRLL